MPDLPPTYTDVEPVHTGGQAEVYKATLRGYGYRLSVKVFFHAPNDSLLRSRLEREKKILRQIDVSGVQKFHDCMLSSKNPYWMSYRWIEGETLTRWLPNERETSSRRRLVLDLLDIAAILRDRRVVHRDISMNNIIVDPSDRPVVIDFSYAFGLSDEHRTEEGVSVGTEPYKAPEVRAGQMSSLESDAYSFGVVFLFVLAGYRRDRSGLESVLGISDAMRRDDAVRSALPTEFRSASPWISVLLSPKPVDRDPERTFPAIKSALQTTLLPSEFAPVVVIKGPVGDVGNAVRIPSDLDASAQHESGALSEYLLARPRRDVGAPS